MRRLVGADDVQITIVTLRPFNQYLPFLLGPFNSVTRTHVPYLLCIHTIKD